MSQTRKHSEKKIKIATHHKTLKHLPSYFKNLDGYFTDDANKYAGHHITYGEVTAKGIQQMSALFETYYPMRRIPTIQQTFYDLGCGLGKMVVGMALLHPIKSVGIELMEERVSQALVAISKVPSNVQKRCIIRTGSFLDSSFSYKDACWIFISNLCLTSDINDKLFMKLGKEVGTGCVIICSKEINETLHHSFVLLKESSISMTWDKYSTVYVYVKK